MFALYIKSSVKDGNKFMNFGGNEFWNIYAIEKPPSNVKYEFFIPERERHTKSLI